MTNEKKRKVQFRIPADNDAMFDHVMKRSNQMGGKTAYMLWLIRQDMPMSKDDTQIVSLQKEVNDLRDMIEKLKARGFNQSDNEPKPIENETLKNFLQMLDD